MIKSRPILVFFPKNGRLALTFCLVCRIFSAPIGGSMISLLLSCLGCVPACSGARHETGLDASGEDNGGHAEFTSELTPEQKLALYEDAMKMTEEMVAYLVFSGPFNGAVRVIDPIGDGEKRSLSMKISNLHGAQLAMDHGMQAVRVYDPAAESTAFEYATNATRSIFLIGLPKGAVARFSRVHLAYESNAYEEWAIEATATCSVPENETLVPLTPADCWLTPESDPP